MLFIEGVGFVNEINQANKVNTDNKVSSNNTINPNSNDTKVSLFDDLLSKETAKLNDQGKTYDLNAIFKEAAETYGVSEELLKAIGYHESGFNNESTSSSGAMGIMQLMPQTAQGLGVNDAYDPYENIMGAAKLLNGLSNLYNGDVSLMLAGYNAGAGNVAKYGGIPPFAETQRYVAKVMETLNSGGVTNMPDTISYNSNMKITNDAATINENNAKQANDLNALVSNLNVEANKDLDDIFSYSQYQLLMKYFDSMMDIISGIGSSNDTEDSSNYLYNSFIYNNKRLF